MNLTKLIGGNMSYVPEFCFLTLYNMDNILKEKIKLFSNKGVVLKAFFFNILGNSYRIQNIVYKMIFDYNNAQWNDFVY